MSVRLLSFNLIHPNYFTSHIQLSKTLHVPISAWIPPDTWTTPLPAKSINPLAASQPLLQHQWVDMGYKIDVKITLLKYRRHAFEIIISILIIPIKLFYFDIEISPEYYISVKVATFCHCSRNNCCTCCSKCSLEFI